MDLSKMFNVFEVFDVFGMFDVSNRVDTAGEREVEEDEGVGREVGEDPEEVELGDAGQGELGHHAHQEDGVEDGEALEEVGEARLQLHVLLVEGPDTQEVAWGQDFRSDMSTET